MRAFPGHIGHGPFLLVGRDDGRAADAAVSLAPWLSPQRLLILINGQSAARERIPRINRVAPRKL